MMRLTCAILLTVCAANALPALAQTPTGAQTNPTVKDNTIGTVVSSTRTTLVVLSEPDQYRLFELNEETTRPAKVPPGASVNVVSTGRDASGVSVATLVRVTSAPAPGSKDTTGAPAPAAAAEPEAVPQSVRQLEQSIKRQTSRFRLGIRGGGALDPELIMVGAQSLIGPFFSNAIWARPNVEFGFGEVTDLIGLNFEGIYRVPVTERNGRWGFFFGGGPAFNFVKLGFTREGVVEDDEDFSFDDFDLDVGLNIVAGVQSRGGMFYELKTTVYANPGMRFLVGTSF
jgi:hypothetical protein